MMQVNRKADPLNNIHDVQPLPARQVTIDLEDGLKSCRAVLADYRMKITSALAADNNNDPEDRQQSSSD